MSLVADRILTLAVTRVKQNCRIALDTMPAHIGPVEALTMIGDLNDECLLTAATSAQMVLDAEKA